MTHPDAPQNDPPPPRLTMAMFWRGLADEAFSLERGLPWTFWQLLVRPGWLVRQYIERRDPRASRPVRYFLVGFVLIALMVEIRAPQGSMDELGAIIRKHLGDEGGGAAVWAVLQRPMLLALATIVPSTAIGLRVAYARHAPTFAEMWVFSVYVIAQVCIYWSLIGIGEGLLTSHKAAAGAFLSAFSLVLPVACVLAACLGYFPQPGFGRIARAALATLLSATLAWAMAAGLLVTAFHIGSIWPSLPGA